MLRYLELDVYKQKLLQRQTLHLKLLVEAAKMKVHSQLDVV